MAKIGTKLPNASANINGVAFSAKDPKTGERVSVDEVDAETAELFVGAGGFYVIEPAPAKGAGKGGEAKPGESKDGAAAGGADTK